MNVNDATKRISSEGGHWYRATGKGLAEPVYDVPLKKPVKEADGSIRTTTTPTVRHAREMGLLRSVTSVIKMLANDGLNKWLLDKALKFGYERAMMDAEISIDNALVFPFSMGNQPCGPDELKQRWFNSVSGRGDHLTRIERALRSELAEAWERQRSEAPDRGTEMHAAIEKWITSGVMPEDDPQSKRACEELGKIAWKWLNSEQSLGDARLGYGCRLDAIMMFETGDWKTVDFKTVQKPRLPYEAEVWQICANDMLSWNAATLGGLNLNAQEKSMPTIIYISQETGEILSIKEVSGEDRVNAVKEFNAILDLWCLLNRHDPRGK